MSFKYVAARYLSGFFLVDFMSVVPFMIAKLASSSDNYIDLLS